MNPLLEVRQVDVHFPVRGGVFRRAVAKVHAVSDVSFVLRTGETLGIVGESGCGKTTLGRVIVGLYRPSAGQILFDGIDQTTLEGVARMQLRRQVQMVFQDPFGSLNPRMTVVDILTEPLRLHRLGDATERRERVVSMLSRVGLDSEYLHRFPHEFSGGQRQRICLARSLMLEPRLVVADEPVSALDVSVRSQVLNLLVALQRDLGLALVFVSHDLTVVKYISDRVAVMYLGRIVEIADSETIYRDAQHPYTMALLDAIPKPDPRRRASAALLEGEPPSPINPPSGCVFHTRCRFAEERCVRERPELKTTVGSEDHLVACHFAGELNGERR